MTVNLLDPDQVVLRSLLERNARSAPNEVFLTFEDGSSWSRSEALQQAYAAAHVLASAGVRQGGVVAVALPNSAGFLRAWWGAAVLGAVLVPVNPAYKGHLIRHMLDKARPDVIVTQGDFAARVLEVGLGSTMLMVPEDLVGGRATPPELDRPIQVWDPIAHAMTSGTTGPSKLVRMTYAHCLNGGEHTFGVWGMCETDTSLVDVPLIHVAALYGVHAAIANRSRLAIRTRPALDQYWEVARDTGATLSQLYSTMVGYVDSLPLRGTEKSHSLRAVVTLPLPPDPEAFKAKFGIPELAIGWGSTEIGSAVGHGPGLPLPAGSTGKVLPGWHVRLVDEHDIEVPEGESGHAVVRCDIPWVITTEYIGDPSATAAVWRNGWFHTGDLLRRNDEGHYFFVDRLKDSLRRRGQNVSSFDVETVVQSFPGVAEAAVVPERSGVDTEDEIKVWIVPQAPAVIDFVDLLHFCAERLPHYMVPRYFETAAEFPKTPTTKIQKHLLVHRGNGDLTWDRVEHGFDVTRHGIKARQRGTANT